MSIYSEVSCTGDYYVVEGQNLDSTSDQCLVIADLGTSDTSTSTSCKWYTAGSDMYTSCDQITLTEPLSWQLTGTAAVCTAYGNSKCNDDGKENAYTTNEGCHSYSADHQDTESWIALKCGL
jgi:hypothetical protein